MEKLIKAFFTAVNAVIKVFDPENAGINVDQQVEDILNWFETAGFKF
ncbi:MAG: hypothetical protein IJ349_10670 [Clostridia bacterium]|nr:hypothetical protein [Clostridia bacterium]